MPYGMGGGGACQIRKLRHSISHCQTYRTLKCNMDFKHCPTLLDKKYVIDADHQNFVQGITNFPLSLAAIKTLLEMNNFAFYALSDRKLWDEFYYIFECTHFKEKSHICNYACIWLRLIRFAWINWSHEEAS